MAHDLPKVREEALAEALGHLRTALELLDRAEAPGQIGAHVDLAICQLQDEIGVDARIPNAAAPNASTTRN